MKLAIIAGLVAGLALCGCVTTLSNVGGTGLSASQAAAVSCAVVQAGIVTAQANAVILKNATAAADLQVATTLVATDCVAAQAALAAAVAASSAK